MSTIRTIPVCRFDVAHQALRIVLQYWMLPKLGLCMDMYEQWLPEFRSRIVDAQLREIPVINQTVKRAKLMFKLEKEDGYFDLSYAKSLKITLDRINGELVLRENSAAVESIDGMVTYQQRHIAAIQQDIVQSYFIPVSVMVQHQMITVLRLLHRKYDKLLVLLRTLIHAIGNKYAHREAIITYQIVTWQRFSKQRELLETVLFTVFLVPMMVRNDMDKVSSVLVGNITLNEMDAIKAIDDTISACKDRLKRYLNEQQRLKWVHTLMNIISTLSQQIQDNIGYLEDSSKSYGLSYKELQKLFWRGFHAEYYKLCRYVVEHNVQCTIEPMNLCVDCYSDIPNADRTKVWVQCLKQLTFKYMTALLSSAYKSSSLPTFQRMASIYNCLDVLTYHHDMETYILETDETPFIEAGIVSPIAVVHEARELCTLALAMLPTVWNRCAYTTITIVFRMSRYSNVKQTLGSMLMDYFSYLKLFAIDNDESSKNKAIKCGKKIEWVKKLHDVVGVLQNKMIADEIVIDWIRLPNKPIINWLTMDSSSFHAWIDLICSILSEFLQIPLIFHIGFPVNVAHYDLLVSKIVDLVFQSYGITDNEFLCIAILILNHIRHNLTLDRECKEPHFLWYDTYKQHLLLKASPTPNLWSINCLIQVKKIHKMLLLFENLSHWHEVACLQMSQENVIRFEKFQLQLPLVLKSTSIWRKIIGTLMAVVSTTEVSNMVYCGSNLEVLLTYLTWWEGLLHVLILQYEIVEVSSGHFELPILLSEEFKESLLVQLDWISTQAITTYPQFETVVEILCELHDTVIWLSSPSSMPDLDLTNIIARQDNTMRHVAKQYKDEYERLVSIAMETQLNNAIFQTTVLGLFCNKT